MGPAIRTLLPLAAAVAISPVPIVAVILILLAPRARGSSGGLLLGWIAGIVLATGTSLLVVEAGNAGDSAPAVARWLQLGLGVLLMAAGIWHWLRRRRTGEPARDRAWTAAIGAVTPVRATMLGLLLCAANPKNLTLCVAAGVALAGAELAAGQDVLAILLFTGIAASTIAVPVVAYAVSAERMRGPLDRVSVWMQRMSGTGLAVVLVALGALLAGTAVNGLR
jgi:threonine/homoserine/homoserine lactone efflux protein